MRFGDRMCFYLTEFLYVPGVSPVTCLNAEMNALWDENPRDADIFEQDRFEYFRRFPAVSIRASRTKRLTGVPVSFANNLER